MQKAAPKGGTSFGIVKRFGRAVNFLASALDVVETGADNFIVNRQSWRRIVKIWVHHFGAEVILTLLLPLAQFVDAAS
jgi:hypothetical protein